MLPVAILVILSLIYLVLQQSCRRLAAQDLVFLSFALIFLALTVAPAALGWLFSFLGLSYLIIEGARQFKVLHPMVFIAPLIVLFVTLKRYDILPLQDLYSNIPEIMGLSYIIFRVIIVLFDARATGARPGVIVFLNFCLSPFTFISGPIQRLRDFREDMALRKTFRLDEAEGAEALTRIGNGAVKTLFVGPFIQNVQNELTRLSGHEAVVAVLHDFSAPAGYGLAALAYLLFLYFNFSGYTDIAIGLGRLFGFRLPENFNNPFVAVSFLEFWSRWHISLSLWFRDYCFSPVLKLALNAGVTNPVLATMPAYFVSFALLGLWHGRTWPLVLCGFLLAVGSVLNSAYRAAIQKILGKAKLSRLNRHPAWQALASAITFSYIAVAITGLWRSGPEFSDLLQSLTLSAAFLTMIMTIVSLAAVLFVIRFLWLCRPVQRLLIMPVTHFLEGRSSLMISIKVSFVIVWYFSFSTNLPDFVYRGF